MTLTRRSLLQAAGLVALPALSQADTPSDAWTRDAHRRLQTPHAPRLDPEDRVIIAAIADAIIPRTESPGALDVGAVDFVELIVAEWLPESEADTFLVGLAALDARAATVHGAPWARLTAAQQQAEIAWAEDTTGSPTPGARAFRRLKGWVVHGWMSSERVQRDVLRVEIEPGDYSGCAPRSTVERR